MDAADLDGLPGEELIVGAPQVKVSGFAKAGKVFIFGKNLKKPISLQASTPQANAFFGSSLAVGNLDGDPKPEVVIGAPKGVSEKTAMRVGLFLMVFQET